MNVLFVATYSGTSGASHSLVNMIMQMKKKGVQPTVIIPNNGPLEELLNEYNITYKKIRLFSWVTEINKTKGIKSTLMLFVKQMINLIQELRILHIIKKNKIELVHINAVTSSNSYLAARISRIPIVWHIREFLEEDLNKTFKNKKKAIHRLNKSDFVIAVSDSVKNKYDKIIDNVNLIRIYNGIDQSYYQNLKNDIFERDEIVLTLVGRLVPQKGHIEVIYALYQIVKRYDKPIKVRFVGEEGNKAFLLKLKKLINELTLEEHIEFIGYRADIYNVWAETDIALVTSKAEAFGRVTIEAMLAGALVIGADTEGTAELISDKYGLLYNQGDYVSLAEKIKYAIDNQEEMRKIASLSKNYALDNFTAKNNSDNIYQVYEDLLS